MPAPPESAVMWLTDGKYTFYVSGDTEDARVGADGVTLSNGVSFEDLYESPFDTIYNSTAFEIGGTYGGLRENMFEFSMEFHIKSTPDVPWRVVASRFRKMLSPSSDAFWHVEIPGVSHRWLRIRLRSTPKLKVEVDPNQLRYGMMLVHFVAAFPRWEENDWTDTYTTTMDTTGGGEEFATVKVVNNTNCEQWIKWSAQAGNAGIIYTLPDFSWGDDRFDRAIEDEDRMIEMPDLILDEHIVVDTDEMTIAGQVVSDLDTQVYQRMNGKEFLYPLPAYTDPVDIPISVKAAEVGNKIQVRVPRNWTHPWGQE